MRRRHHLTHRPHCPAGRRHTGGATGATVQATFSEAIDPATLTTATFTLAPSAGGPSVAATVTYDAAARTATLRPSAALAGTTGYTATVKGGASGVKDPAGNALAADRVWTFTTGAAPSPYLSDRAWSYASNAVGPVEKDRSNNDWAGGDGNPLTLNGVVYAKGLGVHAAAEIRYPLGGTCTRLTASVGVDDEVGAGGSVVFQVWADGVKLYDSGVMTGTTATRTLDVDLTGRNELRLIVTNGGDTIDFDHADWADARIVC
ncbi:MAG: NPCBM/NEW2 domain-containing protein [Dehalococcoidia bacterium]